MLSLNNMIGLVRCFENVNKSTLNIPLSSLYKLRDEDWLLTRYNYPITYIDIGHLASYMEQEPIVLGSSNPKLLSRSTYVWCVYIVLHI